MYKLLIVFSLLYPFVAIAKNKETVKLGAQFQINKKQSLDLRVTQIPKKYPWIERDLDGKTINPEYDATIVAENVEPIFIEDEQGNSYTIPKASKFFAKVKEIVPAKSFWRKEKVKLEFYALAVSDGSFDEYFEETSFRNYDGNHFREPSDLDATIKLKDSLKFDSRDQEKASLKNIAMIGASTLGGAIAGPFMLFSISSVLGTVTAVSALSNPYVVGGAAAVGAGVGLVAGIVHKGGDLKVEPGQKIRINIDDTWAFTKVLGDDLKDKSPLVAQKINDKFVLDILKVETKRDIFGDKALKVLIHYKNKTDQEITYTSFKLVDSTGKAYEANVDDLSFDFYEGLPKEGTMYMSFTVDYPDAPHQLKVLDRITRKTLAYKDVIYSKLH